MMDWELLLYLSPIAVFFWWAGFIATKRMRIEKNKEREEGLRRYHERKAAEEGGEAHPDLSEEK